MDLLLLGYLCLHGFNQVDGGPTHLRGKAYEK